MKKNSLLIIAILCFYGILHAQQGYTETIMNPPGISTGISDIELDDSNNIWLSYGWKYPNSKNGNLVKWDGSKATAYNSSNWPIPNVGVYSVAFANKYIWIGTNLGLYRFDRQGNTVSNWKWCDSMTDKVYCLEAKGNELWMGTNAGIAVMDLTTEKITKYANTLWGYSNSNTFDIEFGGGATWFATDSGLVKMQGSSFSLYTKDNSGLKSNKINCLHWKNSSGELWIGSDSVSQNGVSYGSLYRMKNGVIKNLQEINECYGVNAENTKTVFIEEDKHGNIIASYLPAYNSGRIASLMQVKENNINRLYLETKAFGLPQSLTIGPNTVAIEGNNGELYLAFGGILFLINDVDEIADDQENITQRMVDRPAILDVNQVSAMILNRGDMFSDLNGTGRYEVPKGSCRNLFYASALWLGGIDGNNKLHQAAMTYRNGSDYMPGPLDTITAKGDTGQTPAYLYNKIWKINRSDIELFKKRYADGSLHNGSYTPPDDFLSWPAHGLGRYSRNLAPFVDIDNNGKYNPLWGDYPKIKGDQALYWIFNDNSNIHGETGGAPLGVEVHAMAYAYNCDSISLSDSNAAMNFTTFYEYEIINRSSDDFKDMYYGVWADVDLGNYTDDYIGCSPQGNCAFVYNGDNNDEGIKGYGLNPPMLSYVLLSDTMTNFMYFNNDFSAAGNPTIPQHYYQYMESRWKDSSQLTYGGSGYNTGSPTNYIFPGNPYKSGEWNEASAGSAGDRRFVFSTGGHQLKSGETKKLAYAIVYSRDASAPNGLNTSWAKNEQYIDKIKQLYVNQNFPSCFNSAQLGVQPVENANLAISVYPNPFTGITNIAFALQHSAPVSVTVYDALGREVNRQDFGLREPGRQVLPVNISNQPAGIYFYSITIGGQQYSGKLLHISE